MRDAAWPAAAEHLLDHRNRMQQKAAIVAPLVQNEYPEAGCAQAQENGLESRRFTVLKATSSYFILQTTSCRRHYPNEKTFGRCNKACNFCVQADAF